MRVAASTHASRLLVFIALFLVLSADVASADLRDLDKEISSLLRKVQSSVVTVHAYCYAQPIPPQPAYKPPGVDTLIGSGIVLDTLGHIVTTGHVIRGANRFEVFTRDGRVHNATLIGVDQLADVSVLKISTDSIVPLKFSTDKLVISGALLFAIGNSFGIPSAASLATAVGYRADGSLQVSANLAPGFSGGPVVNSSGEAVGMISAKLTEPVALGQMNLYRGNTRWGFNRAEVELPSTGVILALSASDVRNAADRIIEDARRQKGFLGVLPEDLDPIWRAKVFGLDAGVMISEVLHNSPASKVGVKSGDILTHFLDRTINSSEQLKSLIETYRPGDFDPKKLRPQGLDIRISIG